MVVSALPKCAWGVRGWGNIEGVGRNEILRNARILLLCWAPCDLILFQFYFLWNVLGGTIVNNITSIPGVQLYNMTSIYSIVGLPSWSPVSFCNPIFDPLYPFHRISYKMTGRSLHFSRQEPGALNGINLSEIKELRSRWGIVKPWLSSSQRPYSWPNTFSLRFLLPCKDPMFRVSMHLQKKMVVVAREGLIFIF